MQVARPKKVDKTISLEPTKECVKRLRRDWVEISQSPPTHIIATPHPSNILEWHYLIMGPEDTPYESGIYHGYLKFPYDYPLSPPSIYMLTPNGRFQPNTRLCLSMSDYHPETWSPTWSTSSILVGLLSFMLEDEKTAGSIETSLQEKRQLAAKSMDYNKRNPLFCELFPFLVSEEDLASTSTTTTTTTEPTSTETPAT
eukprot:TRINITY_DN1659_c0_g1_i1.p1 TRINITY_DN1659_c0_g1~~TRINITY_DN1659_c0_g1_i1.p1  ORF type:complete len:221 (-),score=52.97 TRINITY_DN1659_c0_g1_i1:228-824(-)